MWWKAKQNSMNKLKMKNLAPLCDPCFPSTVNPNILSALYHLRLMMKWHYSYFTALEALELRVRPSQHIVGPPWAEHNEMVEVISSEQMLYMGRSGCSHKHEAKSTH